MTDKSIILDAAIENMRNMEPGFDETLRMAEAGDAESQYKIAHYYRTEVLFGFDVGSEAIRWYELAAQQGHAWAQFVLGWESTEEYFGRDLPPLRNEPTEAAKWIRLAAEQGVSEAIECQIDILRFGLLGTSRNPKEAAQWCIRQGGGYPLLEMVNNQECTIPAEYEKQLVAEIKKRAEAGQVDAQLEYGEIMAIGLPLHPADEVEVVNWHNSASEQMDNPPRNGYHKAVIDAIWRNRANCSAKLLRYVGQMYSEGKSVAANEMEARRWYEQSAEKGDALAQFYIAQQHDGVNDDLAAVWYEKSAGQQIPVALNNLAVMYEQGRGVPQSYRQARKLFRLAAQQGDETAQYNMGLVYMNGLGVKADIKKAAKWFRMASGQGCLMASLCLCAITGNKNDLSIAVEKLTQRYIDSDLGSTLIPMDIGDDIKARLETIVAHSRVKAGMPKIAAYTDANGTTVPFRVLTDEARVSATLLGLVNMVSIDRDMNKANHWFSLAIKNGDIVSAYFLALNSYRSSNHDEALYYTIERSSEYGAMQRFGDISEIAFKYIYAKHDATYGDSFNDKMRNGIQLLRETIRINQERDNAVRAQLSFLSHTLSNASAGAPESIRRAARLLSTVQADQPEQLRRVMERLSGQIASLSLIETLVASFKLYASDPERIRASWANEEAGDIPLVRVLALALRQVLTRLFTLPGHARDLHRLVQENTEALVQEFVADIMVLDLESDAEAEKLVNWVRNRLPFLSVRIEEDGSLKFAPGGARFVVTFAVLAEILTNAVKYAPSAPITLSCKQKNRQLRVVCRNAVNEQALKPQETGGTGIAFLRKISHVVGADIQESFAQAGQFEVVFTAKA